MQTTPLNVTIPFAAFAPPHLALSANRAGDSTPSFFRRSLAQSLIICKVEPQVFF